MKSPTPNFIISVKDLNVHYGKFHAIKDVTMDIRRNTVTALIGPSGCGKSTFIRCLNRMNDLVITAVVTGEVNYNESNIYSSNIDATEIRSRIGMVFQKPNPFPKSIFQNVAFGLKVNGFSGDLDEAVRVGKKLKENDEFYNLCMKNSQDRFKDLYTEKIWLKNWNKQWKK